MKKTFLIFALFATFSTFFAQVDFSSTRFGLTGGATYSGVSNAHNPSGKRLSVYGGLLAIIPIDNSDSFYIQPEVEYWGAGESGKNKDEIGKFGYDAIYADNYIAVPIFLKAYFSEAESEFFALAGPQFNFLINQKVTNPAKTYYYPEGGSATYPELNGKASPFNFGISVGLGFSYKRSLEITGRMCFGLSNTYKGLTSTEDSNSTRRKATQTISVGLSYIFQ